MLTKCLLGAHPLTSKCFPGLATCELEWGEAYLNISEEKFYFSSIIREPESFSEDENKTEENQNLKVPVQKFTIISDIIQSTNDSWTALCQIF